MYRYMRGGFVGRYLREVAGINSGSFIQIVVALTKQPIVTYLKFLGMTVQRYDDGG